MQSFSGPYFPAFGLNTGKYRPENSEYRHFSRRNNVHYSSKVLLTLQARIVAGAASEKLSLSLSYNKNMLVDIFSG